MLKKQTILTALRERVAAGAAALEVLEFMLRTWGPGVPDGAEEDRTPRAVLTIAEMLLLLSVSVVHQRDHLIMRVLYATGLRAAELIGLRWADVNFSNRSLFVRAGKGNFDRYVLVDPETLRLLREWRGDQAVSERVFKIAKSSLHKRLGYWARQTGVYQKYLALGYTFSAHSFRHCFATHCFERGMPEAVLDLLLGHTTPKTTVTYLHPDLDFCQQAYAASHVLEGLNA